MNQELEKIVNKIIAWQNNPNYYPLTCGNSSLHNNLVPIIKDNRIVLQCPDCNYEQENVPHIFFSTEFAPEDEANNFELAFKKINKLLGR